MCFVTYLVHLYVDSDMSQSMKVSFRDIWIFISSMIENNHIKYVTPHRAYCKEVKFYNVPSQLYLRHGAKMSCVTPVRIHR